MARAQACLQPAGCSIPSLTPAQDGEPVPAAKEDGTTRSLALFRCSLVHLMRQFSCQHADLKQVCGVASGVAEAQGLADFVLQEVASADEDSDVPLLLAPCPFVRASLQPLQPQVCLSPLPCTLPCPHAVIGAADDCTG